MKFAQLIAKAFVYGIILLIIGETSSRQAGVLNFPLYVKDDVIGYLPQPNQSGTFIFDKSWVFNEKSMGTGKYTPNQKFDILLMGDSIVMGGNPVSQANRLGPQIQLMFNNQVNVWPASAASWSSINAAGYLSKNTDVLQDTDWLVWVLNSGDFAEKSEWKSNLHHPLSTPRFALWHVFHKYVWDRYFLPQLRGIFPSKPTPFVADALYPEFEQFFKQLREYYPKMGIAIVWYPSKVEIPPSTTPAWDLLTPKLRNLSIVERAAWIDVSRSSQWKHEYYRDGIHPTEEGYPVLARIIVEGIRSYR